MELHDHVKTLIQQAVCSICQRVLKYSGCLQIQVHMIVFADDKQLLALDFQETLTEPNATPDDNLMRVCFKQEITENKHRHAEAHLPSSSKASQNSCTAASSAAENPTTTACLNIKEENVCNAAMGISKKRTTGITTTNLCSNNIIVDTRKNRQSFARMSTGLLIKKHRMKHHNDKKLASKSVAKRVISKCRSCGWRLKAIRRRMARPWTRMINQGVKGDKVQLEKQPNPCSNSTPKNNIETSLRKDVRVILPNDGQHKLAAVEASEKHNALKESKMSAVEACAKDSKAENENSDLKITHQGVHKSSAKNRKYGSHTTNKKHSNNVFSSEDVRFRCMVKEEEEVSPKTGECSKSCVKRCSRLKQRRTDPRRRFHCGVCDKSFTFRTNLTRHVRQCHQAVNTEDDAASAVLSTGETYLPQLNDPEQGITTSLAKRSSSLTSDRGNPHLSGYRRGTKHLLDLLEISPIVSTPQVNGLDSTRFLLPYGAGKQAAGMLPLLKHGGFVDALSGSSTTQPIAYAVNQVVEGLPREEHELIQPSGGVDRGSVTATTTTAASVQGNRQDSINSQNSSTSQTIDVVNISNETSSNCGGTGASFVLQDNHDAKDRLKSSNSVSDMCFGHVDVKKTADKHNGISSPEFKVKDLAEIVNPVSDAEEHLATSSGQKTMTGANLISEFPLKSLFKETAETTKETQLSSLYSKTFTEKENSQKGNRPDPTAATVFSSSKEPDAFPVLGLYDMVSPSKSIDNRFILPLTFSPVRSPLFSLATSPISSSTPFFRSSPVASTSDMLAVVDRKLEARRLYNDVPSPTSNTSSHLTGPLLNIPSYLPQSSSPGVLLSSAFADNNNKSRRTLLDHPKKKRESTSQEEDNNHLSSSPTGAKKKKAEEFIDISKLANSMKEKLSSSGSKKTTEGGVPPSASTGGLNLCMSPCKRNSAQTSNKHHHRTVENGMSHDVASGHKLAQQSPTKRKCRVDIMQLLQENNLSDKVLLSPEKKRVSNNTTATTSNERCRTASDETINNRNNTTNTSGRSTTNKYRFACNLCSAKFTFRTNLTRHLKKQHGVTPGDSEGN